MKKIFLLPLLITFSVVIAQSHSKMQGPQKTDEIESVDLDFSNQSSVDEATRFSNDSVCVKAYGFTLKTIFADGPKQISDVHVLVLRSKDGQKLYRIRSQQTVGQGYFGILKITKNKFPQCSDFHDGVM